MLDIVIASRQHLTGLIDSDFGGNNPHSLNQLGPVTMDDRKRQASFSRIRRAQDHEPGTVAKLAPASRCPASRRRRGTSRSE